MICFIGQGHETKPNNDVFYWSSRESEHNNDTILFKFIQLTKKTDREYFQAIIKEISVFQVINISSPKIFY